MVYLKLIQHKGNTSFAFKNTPTEHTEKIYPSPVIYIYINFKHVSVLQPSSEQTYFDHNQRKSTEALNN
jgi:hypothetical protein